MDRRGSMQRLSRYPALPLLFRRLSEKVTIILNDGIREDEKKIVDLWLKEFDRLSCEFIPLEKGCYVIHRAQDVHSTSRWPSGLESSNRGNNPSMPGPSDRVLQASHHVLNDRN
jgi:hypothetical protein